MLSRIVLKTIGCRAVSTTWRDLKVSHRENGAGARLLAPISRSQGNTEVERFLVLENECQTWCNRAISTKWRARVVPFGRNGAGARLLAPISQSQGNSKVERFLVLGNG